MSRIEDGGAVEAGRDDLIMSLQDAIMMWSHSNKTVAVCYVTDAKAAITQLQSDDAEITRLRAENAGMREALEPFAAILDIFHQNSASRPKAGEIMAWEDHRVGYRSLTVEMLEAARAALSNATVPTPAGDAA